LSELAAAILARASGTRGNPAALEDLVQQVASANGVQRVRDRVRARAAASALAFDSARVSRLALEP
jgi:hypothetical protein